MLDRRSAIRNTLAGAVGGAALMPGKLFAEPTSFMTPPAIAPIIARRDRVFKVTVCLRPFRAAGPRIEAERIGSKHVVHHYGHGGSGWSLNWGSAAEAVPLALASGETNIAVVGAGAIGLASAITAQRMGAKVTIYTKDRYPDIRSARATGSWSPHSRIAMAGSVDASFAAKWERMARRTFIMHQSFLGLEGDPIEWLDRFSMSDTPFVKRPHTAITMPTGGTDHFVDYEDRVKDLVPVQQTVAADSHPFTMPYVRRTSTVVYNVADLVRRLENDFQLAGGRILPMDLKGPADFAKIKEKAIINCTGFGARELMRDESVIPVRGQIQWLLPQPEARYGAQYNYVSLLSRRDGIVVQAVGSDESEGFNDFNEEPDWPTVDRAVGVVASMFTPRPAPPAA